MTSPIASRIERLEREAERLREHLASQGVALDLERARDAVASIHGAAGWHALLAQHADAAPDCFHVSIIGTEGIVGDHVHAFGLPAATAVLLDRIRALLRNHVFTSVRAEPDSARLLVLDLVGPEAYARVTLEYGPVQDAAAFVEVTDEIAARSADPGSAVAFVVAQAVRMQDEIRPLEKLPYEERLVEACRDALETEPWARPYADVVLELERLAREGKLTRRRSALEVQQLLPVLAGLPPEQAAKIVSAAAWALSFHAEGFTDISFGANGLRMKPAKDFAALAPARQRAVLH